MTHLLSILLLASITSSVYAQKPSRRTILQEGQQLLEDKASQHRQNSKTAQILKYENRSIPLLGFSFDFPEEWTVGMSKTNESKYGQYYDSDGDYVYISDEQYPDTYAMFIYSKKFDDVTTIEMAEAEWEDAKRQPDHDNVYEYSHLSYIRELDNVIENHVTYLDKPALEIEYTFNNWSKFWKEHVIMFPWGKRIYTMKYRRELDADDLFYEAFTTLLNSFTFHTKEPVFAPRAEEEGFRDLPFSHANRRAIERLKALEILKGYDDGSVKPDNTINRAEFVKIITSPPLIDASEASICDTSAVFSDTPSDAWFTPHVCVAKKRGMIGGYPDGTFRPDKEISFAEAAKIISSFYAESDIGSDDVWYRPFVRFLEGKRAIPLSIRKLSSAITRGEMAEMIYRLQDRVQGEERTLEDLE